MRPGMEFCKTSLLLSYLCIILENYLHNATAEENREHDQHHTGFKQYADHDPQNETLEWGQDERLASDPTHHNVLEAVLQLWWAQRGYVHNARHEKDELRRLKLVYIDRFDDQLDDIEESIEKHIASLSIWAQPQMVIHEDLMNRTAVEEMQRKWREAEEFFSIYEIEGAEELCFRLRQELRAAQEDLPRRVTNIEKMMIEIEEQEEQRRENAKS